MDNQAFFNGAICHLRRQGAPALRTVAASQSTFSVVTAYRDGRDVDAFSSPLGRLIPDADYTPALEALTPDQVVRSLPALRLELQNVSRQLVDALEHLHRSCQRDQLEADAAVIARHFGLTYELPRFCFFESSLRQSTLRQVAAAGLLTSDAFTYRVAWPAIDDARRRRRFRMFADDGLGQAAVAAQSLSAAGSWTRQHVAWPVPAYLIDLLGTWSLDSPTAVEEMLWHALGTKPGARNNSHDRLVDVAPAVIHRAATSLAYVPPLQKRSAA